MKNVCEDLREHAKIIIDLEREKNVTFDKELSKSINY